MRAFKMVGSLFKKPKIKVPQAPGVATRDDVRDDVEKRLELAKRRGGAADIVTGPFGAEASAVGKTTLGS